VLDMALSRAARQYLGVRAILPPDLVYAQRNPTSTDVAYVKGTLWLNLASPAAFMYSGTSGVWIALGSSSSGGVVTINSNAAVAGNYVLAGTANQIAVAQTAGTTTFTIPAAFIAPGSIAATTTVTATLGAITATNGNVVLGTAGNKIVIATGSNASVGTSSAMTAGVVTVATTASSASAKIFYSRATTGGTPGQVSITAQDGTGFTLTSTSNTETSTFNWWIINA
jgi:hypothetical protein